MVWEVFAGGYAVATWILIMAEADNPDPESPLHLGKRVGEKGMVTVCRVPFVIVFMPAISAVFVLIEHGPSGAVKFKKWLVTEREEA